MRPASLDSSTASHAAIARLTILHPCRLRAAVLSCPGRTLARCVLDSTPSPAPRSRRAGCKQG
eukprot:2464758-Pleurochrysis_carterae.AAC.1